MTEPDNRFILLSGCSGGGKSALLGELGARGFVTFEEPGRAVVKEQLALGGVALPWIDARAFAELALTRSIANFERAMQSGGTCFFDRGVIDAANWFVRSGMPLPEYVADAVNLCRYRKQIFLVPPWKEIFVADPERRHGFEEAVAEYESLLRTVPRFGYEPVIVPKLPVIARADFVMARLNR